MNVTTVGIDLAKNVFSVHGVGKDGKVLLNRSVGRGDLLPMFVQMPPCLIGMEACSGTHHFARELRRLGHDARIMAPRFVAPYRKSGKNDGNDVEAICEAVALPNMRFVAVKSVEQQTVLALHRVRKEVSDQRTALINQLRGMLCEFGVVLPRGRYSCRHKLPPALKESGNGIPELARRLFHEVNQRIGALDVQILAHDREIEALARHSEAAQRLMEIPGVGSVTATAIVASVADMKIFKSRSEFAAWLGLVPRQYSTGGKVRLGRITKQGDVYLRTLVLTQQILHRSCC
ncbi:IS110 family transposase [Azoarcus sp. L1K30]|uniref:IS110 family transposase n=1 Tax=Azoarcus sp. L1K30 TaxID=2820277 RepID=UPI001B822C95|nr:IS110 family transposase [Azoarcus sp. L1K30]MBR0566894.1 IS110 family transposase [Azoarcus sp. L1K30]